MDFLTAFLTGLVGSLHCLGMCGPIVIGLPLHRTSYSRKMIESMAYNFGRVFTYGLMGALFGLFGKGIQLAGLQQWASIILGVILIVSAVWPYLFRERWGIARISDRYSGKLVSSLRKLFELDQNRRSASGGRLFLIGLLNGLLPCGLVYVALAGAVNTNEVLSGMLYMMIFGLATIPALFALSLLGNALVMQIRKRYSKLITIFIIALGILFILRGLDLGIHLISPKTKKLEIKTEQVDSAKTSEPEGSCCK